MKTAIPIALATLGAVVTALAQGIIALDNSLSDGSLTLDRPGNWYGGTFGMEVWELNSGSIPAGINLSATQGSGVRGYNAMVAAGFTKEAVFSGQRTFVDGDFSFGELQMPDVNPVGSTVVLALAAWNTSDPSWSGMLAHADQSTRAGIIAFLQRTADPSIGAVPAALAMNQDLVMTAIPEPSALGLAALGGVLFLLLCRRRPV